MFSNISVIGIYTLRHRCRSHEHPRKWPNSLRKNKRYSLLILTNQKIDWDSGTSLIGGSHVGSWQVNNLTQNLCFLFMHVDKLHFKVLVYPDINHLLTPVLFECRKPFFLLWTSKGKLKKKCPAHPYNGSELTVSKDPPPLVTVVMSNNVLSRSDTSRIKKVLDCSLNMKQSLKFPIFWFLKKFRQ